jgi:hypothetical protein
MPPPDDPSPDSKARRSWLRRLLITALGIEVVWLVVINAALTLPVTQDLLNRVKPEKFQVRWERAWSWYPGQVTAIKPFANGQSRSQQWQASVDRVHARIALLPLLVKRVHIPWGEAVNAEYRQRPRLKPDTDYTALLAHYPDIEGYEVLPVSDRPLPDRRPWKTVLGEVEVTGSHSIWIHQFRAAFDGDLGGGLSVVARGGPLEMDIDEIDIDLGGAWVNSDQPMVDRGSIRGQFGFVPFRPRENKGLPMLGFATADLTVSLDTRRLKFIDVFLLNFDDVHVDGSGAVTGRVVYDQGVVAPGTDLHVDANDLRVEALSLDISGTGGIDLGVADSPDSLLLLDFAFHDLVVQHQEDDAPMLEGDTLELQLSGSRSLSLAEDGIDFQRTISLDIDTLAVPDLSRFQRFVPAKWPLRLNGGAGRLGGRALLGPNVLSADLQLASGHADLSVGQYDFDTDLDATLRLENPDVKNRPTRLDGTGLRLSESTLQRDADDVTAPWAASIEIGEARLSFLTPAEKQRGSHAFDLLRLMGQEGARTLLADSAGALDFEASVSSLAFLDALLTSEEPARVRGDGNLEGRIVLKEGLPDIGTRMNIRSGSLNVTVLDYLARGDGQVDLTLEEGGTSPDWHLAVRLEDGTMNRLGDGAGGIEAVQLLLDAVIKDVTFEPGPRDFDLRFRIPSAIVPDMGLFNGYLPTDSPLSFTGGTADLVLDLRLSQDDAQGFVRLFGERIDVALDGQTVRADLVANLLVVGGQPRDMAFDLAGSTVAVENVRVQGAGQGFEDEAWSGTVFFERADTTWRQPPRLDIEAKLLMSDSRPFVALMRNHGGPEFAGRVLTVEDIEGTALLTAADNRIRVPSAEITSNDITVGMKALIADAEREGMIFLRWKALRALLKVRDGKRNVDVINSRATFDRYEPPR